MQAETVPSNDDLETRLKHVIVDALELALAINKEFGVRTEADDERNRDRFHSVRSLAAFIRTERAAAEGGEQA